MATLVDLPEDTEDNNTFDDVNAEAAETVEAVEEANPPSSEDELPEKYRGKSAAELAEMHANLEKLLGNQSQEVGELRRAFDQMIQQNMAASQQQSAPPVDDDVDYWTDPKAAIDRSIETHPAVQEARQVKATLAKKEALDRLNQEHPDAREVVRDQKFQEWVGKSKIRTQLFAAADQGYDYDAANELLSLWKERNATAQQAQEIEKVAKKAELRNASTGSSRSNPDGQSTKKTYRRRDIIELMNRDPKRYEALQPEIMKAYREGRVK